MSHPEDRLGMPTGTAGTTGTADDLSVHRDPVVDPAMDPPLGAAGARTAPLELGRDARRDDDLHRGSARDRDRDHDRGDHDDRRTGADVVERFAPVEQRTKLLVAIAAMVALTLLLTLATLLATLADDGGAEPVIVEGVPCLVEDGPDGQAVLYCQR
jgi:hypothetical protein